MKLNDLLEGLEYRRVGEASNPDISALVYDSRKLVNGCMFVCISGTVRDGHDFAEDAVKAGAAVLVVERELTLSESVVQIVTPDSRKALALLAAAWFGHPARSLKTIGITGTKGKTTTAYMVHHMLEEVGIKTGLIGTVEIQNGKETIPACNTTPESYLLQQYFREMADNGCQAVVMEVSSQGLKMSRVEGFEFDYGIFTNLEPDHIGPNEHESFEEYAECKSRLFRKCKVGILNADDPHVGAMLEGHTCKVITYGVKESADLMAKEIDLHCSDGKMMVSYLAQGVLKDRLAVAIPGMFTVYNSLTAVAVCLQLGVSVEAMKKALLNVAVKGRLEAVPISNQFSLMIDYAHNAMSLKSLLEALRKYDPKRLVCLFGCGGNRSRDRRFEMGEISSRLADLTIVTSDNPRFEKPEDILEDILVGVKKADGAYVLIPDRKEAIRYAIVNAQPGDVIVLAGKGHEDYQEICGVKYPMDERVLIREILEEMTEEERKKCGLRM